MIRHKGIRPKHKFDEDKEHPSKSFKRTHNFEPYPEGGGKWWSKKELESGCDMFMKECELIDGVRYCEFCDAWFSENQFVKESEE